MDVSKPAECRNYSLRCTLCPSFLCYPFSFSPSVDLSPIFHPSLPLPPAPFSCSFATRSLPLDTLLLLSPSRPSVSRLSSCDTPNLYALILVHTDSGYLPGKGYILLATFTLHNARQSLFPPIPGSVHTRSFFFFFFATAFLLSFFFLLEYPRSPERRFFHDTFSKNCSWVILHSRIILPPQEKKKERKFQLEQHSIRGESFNWYNEKFIDRDDLSLY